MKTEGGVVLRDFRETDFDSLVKLWTATGIGNPARGDTLECIRATLDHGGRLFLLDESDVVVGSAWITDDGRRLYLHHMAVLPEFQGRGLSRRLMDAAVALARERRRQVKLEVAESNARAIALYLKYGFGPLETYRTMIRRSMD